MKHPNGYGSIFKLSGKRRKPWAVRITTGWSDDKKQRYSYLGYYKTRPDAIAALAEYNNNPYDLNARKMTFKELYERYLSSRPNLSESNKRMHNMCFNLSESLHDLIFIDIRKPHMQKVIDTCEKSHETKLKIRSLYNQMYRYATENDLVQKNYAQFIDMPANETKSKRKPFDMDEIEVLWMNIEKDEYIDTILIMIYTGLRPGELLDLKLDNIHLDDRYMIGGLKTAAGKDRIIPIHKKIHPLIERRMLIGKELNYKRTFLIGHPNGTEMTYQAYYSGKWKKAMNKLGMDHTPHNCRHTFASLMDLVGANRLAIKRIMGHASNNVTDAVYIHKNIEQLIEAIDMLE